MYLYYWSIRVYTLNRIVIKLYKLYKKRGYHYFLILESKEIDEINKKIYWLLETTDIKPDKLEIYSGSSPIHSILGRYEYD